MPSPSSSFSSSSSLSSSLSSTKALIHTLFLLQIRRVARALSSAKSFLVKLCRKGSSSSLIHSFIYFTRKRKNSKMYFGSFRLHYNWCSSRYLSVPASAVHDSFPAPATNQVSYYDGCTWKYEDAGGDHDHPEQSSGLSGYLQWLEEEKNEDDDWTQGNEIDRLADMFIAGCHEKFILEKQESDRRFQEMLARSM